MNSTMEQIKDFLMVGGPVVWILLGFSVIAVTIFLVKLWQLAMLRAESRKNVNLALDAWRARDIDGALAKLSEKRPVESIVAYSMEALRHANREVATVREEAERRALNTLHDLRSFLRPLEIIGSLSPLLGLLGTVLGMITAFQQMEGQVKSGTNLMITRYKHSNKGNVENSKDRHHEEFIHHIRSHDTNINHRDVREFFPKATTQYVVNQPLRLLKLADAYDIKINVNGGGVTGQAGAIRLGISRALLKIDPTWRAELKKAGFLTRDARKVERKKYGVRGARRAFQFSKR